MSTINLFSCVVNPSDSEKYVIDAPGLNFKSGTTLQGMPVQGEASEILAIGAPIATFSGEIEALRVSLLLDESRASIASFLALHGQQETVFFTPLEYYNKHNEENATLLQELKALRELKRRAALGLLSCSCPPSWHKARDNKNRILSSLASFLVQISAEHRRTDAYRISLSDLLPICPSVDRQNRPLGQTDLVKLINAQFSKLKAELVPLVDPWETDSEGKPKVKRTAFKTPLMIEKLKGYDCLWEVRFEYSK